MPLHRFRIHLATTEWCNRLDAYGVQKVHSGLIRNVICV